MELRVAQSVRSALTAGHPVVALESTVIAHGLPRPMNLETARAIESEVRAADATPATIALADGAAIVGADDALITRLACEDEVAKVSLRDLAPILAARALGATTVAATVEIAARAGIEVVSTGGIGGVHRGAQDTFDVSADLLALSRNPICVVCAGAKLVLDLAKTLEQLETLGVPVVGFGTDELPAFYVRSSGLRLAHRADDASAAAAIVRYQQARGAGVVVAVPIPEQDALPRSEAEKEVTTVLARASREGIRGAALTPYLLGALGEATSGRSLAANVSLLRNNARVAASIARALAPSPAS